MTPKYWSDQIFRLAQRLSGGQPEIGQALIQAVERWGQSEVALVFGGHFSAGKSCLLNAAIRRSLLPVDDLPETGTLCLLRRGERDDAVVHTGKGSQAIPCTTTALREQVALISDSGERKASVGGVTRLDIRLRGESIPPRAVWIDSPGINDTQAMEECARRAARMGDILVWVINSRQPLSETEVEFVQAHRGQYGPDSVIFLLNAFLTEDIPDAWNRFMTRNTPRIEQMLVERLETEQAPLMVTVSARALNNPEETGFGRSELDGLLQALSRADHPLICRARTYRMVRLLERIDTDLTARVEQEREREAMRHLQQQRDSLQELRRQAKTAFDSCCIEIRAEVGRQSELLLGSIAADATLQRGDHYADRLHEAWETTIASRIACFELDIHEKLHERKLPNMPFSAFRHLESLLLPRWVPVNVPQHTPQSRENLGGEMAAGVVDFVKRWSPAGAVVDEFGARLGRTLLGGDGRAEALGKDAEGAKSNLLQARAVTLYAFDTGSRSARQALEEAIAGLLPSLPASEAAANHDEENNALLRELGTLRSLAATGRQLIRELSTRM